MTLIIINDNPRWSVETLRFNEVPCQTQEIETDQGPTVVPKVEQIMSKRKKKLIDVDD